MKTTKLGQGNKPILTYNDGEVLVYAPTEKLPYFQIKYRNDSGKWSQTKRAKRAKAIELAKEIAARQAEKTVDQPKLSINQLELLKLLDQIPNPATAVSQIIERYNGVNRLHISDGCAALSGEYRARITLAEEKGKEPPKKTVAKVIETNNRINETLGDLYFDELNPQVLQKWVNRQAAKYEARGVVNQFKGLKRLVKKAKFRKNVPADFDPFEGVELPSDERIVRKFIWRADELESVFQALVEAPETLRVWRGAWNRVRRDKAIAMLAICAFAGLRPSEVHGVKGQRSGILWEDIDLDRRRLYVRKSKNGTARYVKLEPNPGVGLSTEVSDLIFGALEAWLEPYREAPAWEMPCQADDDAVAAGHPVCPRSTQEILAHWLKYGESKDKAPSGIIATYRQDGWRKTWFSSAWALGINKLYLCDQNDNSPSVFDKHYSDPAPKNVGLSWFGVRPATGRNNKVVQFAA